MLSPEAEIESLRSTIARYFSVYGVVVSPMALTFQVGVPPGGIDAPFDALRIELVPKAYIPFFLPSVPPLGTFGAFISMRDPIPNRRALLDIGVSGPLVGFAIAIPVTLAGLALSAASPASGLTLAGEAQPSLLFRALSLFFPLPATLLTHPHPLAFSGWFRLFLTAINPLPP